jgi:hypothetical protein
MMPYMPGGNPKSAGTTLRLTRMATEAINLGPNSRAADAAP